VIEFAGLNKFSNVVVGMEAFAGCQDTLANLHGDGRSDILRGQFDGSIHKHLMKKDQTLILTAIEATLQHTGMCQNSTSLDQ
jgi:hypothetical protein